MRVLVGKTFGLGNAVMSVPMIKAIRSLSAVERLDVLIGSTPDDLGAFDVFVHLRDTGIIDKIFIDNTGDREFGWHDVAIMSIPFDGRWRNGRQYLAERILDCRTRPDPSTTGLVSWKKHEIEYQMENARELGYVGPTPDTSFLPYSKGWIRDVYLGVGGKRNGEWSSKHWGNVNFIELVKSILTEYPDANVWSTGSALDWKLTLQPIVESLPEKLSRRFFARPTTFQAAFDVLKRCGLYVGNDTGMMHVAASLGIPCVSIFMMENSIIKNPPWGNGHVTLEDNDDTLIVFPEKVMKHVRRLFDAH